MTKPTESRHARARAVRVIQSTIVKIRNDQIHNKGKVEYVRGCDNNRINILVSELLSWKTHQFNIVTITESSSTTAVVYRRRTSN